MRWILCLLLTSSSMAAGVVPCAALSEWLDPGKRVRVSAEAPERCRWTGSVVSIVGDTLRLQDSELGVVPVPAFHITRLEVSLGRLPNGVRGAGWGLVIGALAGAAIGYVAYHEPDLVLASAGASAAVGSYYFGIIGLAVGAGIGLSTRSERWADLPLEALHEPAQP